MYMHMKFLILLLNYMYVNHIRMTIVLGRPYLFIMLLNKNFINGKFSSV